ncbi:MAG: aspartate ammonia-lyase [Capsulimonadaceae bacterium]|nr:aspartate ammonia-lyase [Capsulimonadaceae bacterium]
MIDYRVEHDLLGELPVPAGALYGIHAQRAAANFQIARRPVHPALIHAYGAVKLACARANKPFTSWSDDVYAAIEAACAEMMDGSLDEHIIVDALQGGAGTSTNMNVNEVLANRALALQGLPPGSYETIHPLDDINRHQSTNDTYPTALKIAAISLLGDLERSVIALQEAFQAKEREFADVVKVGRTEMQDATLTTLGRTMGAFADPLSRDRWRIYKCVERLRTVNLGGTAIGTGLGAPRRYIFAVTDILREITGMGLARAENLIDATQNTDVFVEVSGILRALASTLIKISGDLRLLSSGPECGLGELRLPALQAGSSIMPGKVNPVAPEAATQAALEAMARDGALTMAASMGSLELNPFLPLIADSLLTELDLLTAGCDTLRKGCIEGLEADRERCGALVNAGTAALTALVDTIGYEAVTRIASDAAGRKVAVRDAAIASGLVTADQFDAAVSPEAVTRLGSPGREV